MEYTRPELTAATTATDFRSFYWLKQELVDFCRANRLATGGAKQEISARIERFLATGERQAPTGEFRRPTGVMPAQLSRETMITPSFRCSQQLRAFFVAEIGPHFHFDRTMREFIKHGAGKTLGQAIEVWQSAAAQPAAESEIDTQFEYNRHMREFFKANQGATLPQAVKAWREQRAQRREP